MDYICGWKYDYVCVHRADALNALGNIRMISRAWTYKDEAREATFVLYLPGKKGKQKSPGRATSRSCSQPPTPGGKEKVTQINLCIANNQMHDKHKD